MEGGIGTQQLTDVTPTIILNVPLDRSPASRPTSGIDYYASASTDRIDQVLSSPSAHDTRYHGDFGYSREHWPTSGTIVGVGAGVSKEYDYLSFNVAASWARTSPTATASSAWPARCFSTRSR